MADAGDTVTLHHELAYADVLPVTWQRLERPPDAGLAAHWTDRNLRLLQACAALEEHGAYEKADDDLPHSAELQRIDLKVNLLLDMVGHLVAASQARPAAVPVRFNTRGAVWQAAGPGPRRGERGAVQLHLKECIVQPLTLTGVIAEDSADGIVQVNFDAIPEQVADHIEKLVFRRHRRQIAGVRHARRK